MDRKLVRKALEMIQKLIDAKDDDKNENEENTEDEVANDLTL